MNLTLKAIDATIAEGNKYLSNQNFDLSLTTFENARKNKELEKDLRKMGLGFVHADGMWRECKNRSIEYKD